MQSYWRGAVDRDRPGSPGEPIEASHAPSSPEVFYPDEYASPRGPAGPSRDETQAAYALRFDPEVGGGGEEGRGWGRYSAASGTMARGCPRPSARDARSLGRSSLHAEGCLHRIRGALKGVIKGLEVVVQPREPPFACQGCGVLSFRGLCAAPVGAAKESGAQGSDSGVR